MKKPGLIQTTAGDDLQQDPLPAYTNRLSRRDSLKLLAALAASTLLPALPGWAI